MQTLRMWKINSLKVLYHNNEKRLPYDNGFIQLALLDNWLCDDCNEY